MATGPDRWCCRDRHLQPAGRGLSARRAGDLGPRHHLASRAAGRHRSDGPGGRGRPPPCRGSSPEPRGVAGAATDHPARDSGVDDHSSQRHRRSNPPGCDVLDGGPRCDRAPRGIYRPDARNNSRPTSSSATRRLPAGSVSGQTLIQVIGGTLSLAAAHPIWVWLSSGLRPAGHRDEAWLKRGLPSS